jgi:serine/tyrosine/threonine adenylyltransferase
MDAVFPFEHSYARLPARFFARVAPTPVAAPRLIRLNDALGASLRIDTAQLDGVAVADIFAGSRLPDGALPLAMAYAGHQFGVFVPQLGDGRAILLGEVVDRDGVRRDIQLKGAGQTPFSRRGDGRAALGPVLREYLLSEAMAALGIPTTRALAAVSTGERVVRETMLPGAVFTRVATSHIRVGTFQYCASRGDTDGVRILADYVIDRHYRAAADADRPYRALLDAVIAAQAALIPQWLLVGFIHGVMNTDNTSIAGETIDYGPCAFMDHYDPRMVFSSIDVHGRYAYLNQPAIAEWNLARFAECLLPLLDDDADRAVADAQDALAAFMPAVQDAYRAGLLRKIGLQTERAGDGALVQDLLTAMADGAADFTLTFRSLSDAVEDPERDADVRSLFDDAAVYDAWAERWRARLAQEPAAEASPRDVMRRANPVFIPRNHRVEAVIRAAVDNDDFEPFEELNEVLSRPFDDRLAYAEYQQPPQRDERVLRTFCGT